MHWKDKEYQKIVSRRISKERKIKRKRERERKRKIREVKK